MPVTNIKRLCGKKYVVTYDDKHDGRGAEFYIVPGEYGYISPHYNEGSLNVACFTGHHRGIGLLNEIGIWVCNRDERQYFEIDARDWEAAAEAIEAQLRTVARWKQK